MKKIFLVCTYKNEDEKSLIIEAASQAVENSAKLIVLTIIDSTETSEMPYGAIIEDYRKNMKQFLDRYFEIIKKKFPDLDAATILKEGFIVDSIASVIQEYGNQVKTIFLCSKNKRSDTISKIIASTVKISNAKITICPMEN